MRELNYDDVIAPPKVKITIDKKEYVEPQPTLEQIIEYEQAVKELNASIGEKLSGSETFERWVTVIRSIFPSISVEVLRKKQPAVLKKIAMDCTTFMQESMFADAVEPKEAVKADKKKEK